MVSYVLFVFYTAGYDFANREAGVGQGRAQHGSVERDAPLRHAGRKRQQLRFYLPAFLREESSPPGVRRCGAK